MLNLDRYCATRALHGLAIDGHAPKILRTCTKSGVPIYCFAVTMLFPLLSLLAIRASTAQVIMW
jgi:yeast amino acid transporter